MTNKASRLYDRSEENSSVGSAKERKKDKLVRVAGVQGKDVGIQPKRKDIFEQRNHIR